MQGILQARSWRRSGGAMIATIIAVNLITIFVATASAAVLQAKTRVRDQVGPAPSDSLRSAPTAAIDGAGNAPIDSALAPLDSALAVVDSTQILVPWQPSPTDTVTIAVLAEASTLSTVLRAHAALTDAGAPVFARVRSDGARYWYEVVAGPFPAAAALDSALAGLDDATALLDGQAPPDTSAVRGELKVKAPELRRPQADLWERQSRGIVAAPQHLAGRIPPPAPSSIDSSQGG